MNKLNKIIIVINIILFIFIILAIIGLYSYMVQTSKMSLKSTLTNAENNMEIRSKQQELEERIEIVEKKLNSN